MVPSYSTITLINADPKQIPELCQVSAFRAASNNNNKKRGKGGNETKTNQTIQGTIFWLPNSAILINLRATDADQTKLHL